MSQLHVLVTTIRSELAAEAIAASVARSADLVLLGNRVAMDSEIEELLGELPPGVPSALMLVGPTAATKDLATAWLQRRKQLVLLRVDVIEDVVEVAARRVGLDSLLAALRDLADRSGCSMRSDGLQKSRVRHLAIARRDVLPLTLSSISSTRLGRSKSPGRGRLRHSMTRLKG